MKLRTIKKRNKPLRLRRYRTKLSITVSNAYKGHPGKNRFQS